MDWLENQERLKTIDRPTTYFIQTTTGTDLHFEDNEEVIDVCKAWKSSMNQAEAKGKVKGGAEGEDRLSRLITHLIEIGQNDEILSVTKNAVLRNQLYKKYSIVYFHGIKALIASAKALV